LSTSVLLIEVTGPPAAMPPPLPVAWLFRNVLLVTVRVPAAFWSPKPPPVAPAELLLIELLVMVTAPLPALPMPPPTPSPEVALLPVTFELNIVRLALWNAAPWVGWMASSQMPAPWLTAVLLVMKLPLMKILPEPSVSTPPPASPALLPLTVTL